MLSIETMPNMLDAQKLYLKYGFEYIDSPMEIQDILLVQFDDKITIDESY